MQPHSWPTEPHGPPPSGSNVSPYGASNAPPYPPPQGFVQNPGGNYLAPPQGGHYPTGQPAHGAMPVRNSHRDTMPQRYQYDNHQYGDYQYDNSYYEHSLSNQYPPTQERYDWPHYGRGQQSRYGFSHNQFVPSANQSVHGQYDHYYGQQIGYTQGPSGYTPTAPNMGWKHPDPAPSWQQPGPALSESAPPAAPMRSDGAPQQGSSQLQVLFTHRPTAPMPQVPAVDPQQPPSQPQEVVLPQIPQAETAASEAAAQALAAKKSRNALLQEEIDNMLLEERKLQVAKRLAELKIHEAKLVTTPEPSLPPATRLYSQAGASDPAAKLGAALEKTIGPSLPELKLPDVDGKPPQDLQLAIKPPVRQKRQSAARNLPRNVTTLVTGAPIRRKKWQLASKHFKDPVPMCDDCCARHPRFGVAKACNLYKVFAYFVGEEKPPYHRCGYCDKTTHFEANCGKLTWYDPPENPALVGAAVRFARPFPTQIFPGVKVPSVAELRKRITPDSWSQKKSASTEKGAHRLG